MDLAQRRTCRVTPRSPPSLLRSNGLRVGVPCPRVSSSVRSRFIVASLTPVILSEAKDLRSAGSTAWPHAPLRAPSVRPDPGSACLGPGFVVSSLQVLRRFAHPCHPERSEGSPQRRIYRAAPRSPPSPLRSTRLRVGVPWPWFCRQFAPGSSLLRSPLSS